VSSSASRQLAALSRRTSIGKVENCSEPPPLVVPATMRKPASAWDNRLAGASTLNRAGPIRHLGSKARVSGQDVGKKLSVLLSNHAPRAVSRPFKSLRLRVVVRTARPLETCSDGRRTIRIDQELVIPDDPAHSRRVVCNNRQSARHRLAEDASEGLVLRAVQKCVCRLVKDRHSFRRQRHACEPAGQYIRGGRRDPVAERPVPTRCASGMRLTASTPTSTRLLGIRELTINTMKRSPGRPNSVRRPAQGRNRSQSTGSVNTLSHFF